MDIIISTAIKKIRKYSKRIDALAIFKESTKTQATNFTLKYVDDQIQILTEYGKWSKI